MCENCGAPVRPYEDFCGEICWEEWHAVNDPETPDKVTVSR
ncbi:hypothetical protein KGG72_gp77 [Streptomyces phage Salutena]|uniref:Uncharacterized protein n=1 Tax=Streptomyces phage Salutena TaxID=2767576 RepID=A0A7S6U085_9CAUD|nr:hypothetical protein KGG72_gp77 [Streptomyces phage Salutena]QOV06207.1 hypothetical protein CPT_Salutena_077 [Streptomyces phage Salutena]